jgi:mannose-6-phosphate isomerase-like protein (cupin superfamily)
MAEIPSLLIGRPETRIKKEKLIDAMFKFIADLGYTIEELTTDKPWGGGFRFVGSDADRFLQEFFPGLSPIEARGGVEDAELSPKFLLVLPGQRLSWQYHERRTEVWRFLTPGAYKRSPNDDEGDVSTINAGDVVSFSQGERHRLIGAPDSYTLVAEIWQHTNPAHLSDEADIIRLQDDYKRV